jgi:undecaprenyl-diphosphatase
MNVFHALVLGLVEGLTEFLPISSTAHLEIAALLLKLQSDDFLKTFEIVIQSGAILAVVVLYLKLLIRNMAIWKRIIAAFIPTAVIGFLLYKIIKSFLLGNTALLVWTIGIGGLVLILVEYFKPGNTGEDTEHELETLSYSKAFMIGLAQAVAVVPGVSRSAATIVAGRLIGVSRKAIVEFSFLLAIPTIAAATGLDLIQSAPVLTASHVGLLAVGFIASFISAILAIRAFLKLVKGRNLVIFGVYRIILALVLFFYII